MKKLLITLLAAVTLAACGSGRIGPRNVSINLGTLVDAATLDAASSAATIASNRIEGYGLVTLYFDLTDANDSVTAVTMTCAAPESSGGNVHSLMACDAPSSGSSTCYTATWVYDPSGVSSPKRWAMRIDMESYRNLTCTVTDTGGLVADVLTVTGWAAVKGS